MKRDASSPGSWEAGTATGEVPHLARDEGILRPRDLRERDIPRECLVGLVRIGQLVRVAHGLYVLADADVSEHHTLAQAAEPLRRDEEV
jgi:hypothetical protein